jgi:hypothetical protein
LTSFVPRRIWTNWWRSTAACRSTRIRPRHRLRAAEGVRTNMRVVFEAVAHHNPVSAEQLPEDAWNQMVLKALFVGSTLSPDRRSGQPGQCHPGAHAGDYAHERWSAGRQVSPELWRCVGPFASGALLADLDGCSRRARRPSVPLRCSPCAAPPIPKPA